jgi:hypothetical protein
MPCRSSSALERLVRYVEGLPCQRLQQRAHLSAGEGAHGDALEDRLALEAGQHLGEGVGAVQVGVPIGAKFEQGRVRELPHEELQQEQRGVVRPVQVVEQGYQWPYVGQSREEGSDTAEQAEARRIRLG